MKDGNTFQHSCKVASRMQFKRNWSPRARVARASRLQLSARGRFVHSTQDMVCNTESLPRANWETTNWWRLAVCAYNVEQEDPLCGKPSGVCYHHTEWEDSERMSQSVRGQRQR